MKKSFKIDQSLLEVKQRDKQAGQEVKREGNRVLIKINNS